MDELITISERVTIMMPSLSQVNLDITPGNTYKLTFNADITTGVIKVYQGTQLIYSTAILPIGIQKEVIHVSERVMLDKRGRISIFDSVTIIENNAFNIFYPVSRFESITVSENVSLILPNLSLISPFDSITVSENVTIRRSLAVSVFDSVTVTSVGL